MKSNLLKSFGPKHYFMEGDWVRWYKTHELHYVSRKSMPRSDSGQRSFHLEKTLSACTLPVNMHGVAATSLIWPGKIEQQVICLPCQEKAKEAEKWLVGEAIWLPSSVLQTESKAVGCLNKCKDFQRHGEPWEEESKFSLKTEMKKKKMERITLLTRQIRKLICIYISLNVALVCNTS